MASGLNPMATRSSFSDRGHVARDRGSTSVIGCSRRTVTTFMWLYEKVGRQIVPLRSLAAGPHGEVLEVPIPDRPNRSETFPMEGEWETWNEPAGTTETRQLDDPEAAPPSNRPPDAAAYRPLLPDPGQKCAVRFVDFRGVLQSQLTHPERLRDSHLLSCLVQVYE